MVNQDIVNFIRRQDAHGVSRQETREALLSQGGWDSKEIREALAVLGPPPPPAVHAPHPAYQTPLRTHASALSPTSFVLPQRGGGKRKRVIAALVLAPLALGVAAGSVYAFVPSVNETVRFALANPEQKTLLSLKKLSEADSYLLEFAGSSSITSLEEGTSPEAAFIRDSLLNGKSEFMGTVATRRTDDPAHPEMFATFSTIIMSGTTTLSIKGNLYRDAELTAFRLNEPKMLIIFDLGALLGQWIDLSLDSLAHDAAEAGMPSETIEKASILVEKHRETLPYLVKRAPEFSKIVSADTSSEAGGEPALYYAYEIDPAALKRVLEGSPLFTSGDISEEDKETLRKGLSESMARVRELRQEIWIGKESRYPRKSVLTFREEVEMPVPDAGTYERTTTYAFTLKGFNEPVTIEHPSRTLSIKEAFELVKLNFEF
jgi:hypothetical protein